jgi:hypothetical protein
MPNPYPNRIRNAHFVLTNNHVTLLQGPIKREDSMYG